MSSASNCLSSGRERIPIPKMMPMITPQIVAKSRVRHFNYNFVISHQNFKRLLKLKLFTLKIKNNFQTKLNKLVNSKTAKKNAEPYTRSRTFCFRQARQDSLVTLIFINWLSWDFRYF